jgi:hypothetical protein
MSQSQSLPDYVIRGAEQVFPQPYAADRVSYYGFILPADVDAIQARVCDRFFNTPSGGAVNFRPVGGWALLTYDNLGRLASDHAEARNDGWFEEREAAIWVLVEEQTSGRFYWTIPYIFVDIGYAIATGREIYGFPKAHGWIEIPSATEYASFFGAETVVLPERSHHTQGVRRPILSTRLTDPGDSGIGATRSSVMDLARAAGDVLRNDSTIGIDGQTCQNIWSFLSDLFQRQAPMVFLKQFRSATQPEKACYQAIVATDIKLTGFHGGRLMTGAYATTIPDYASHPIRHDLGFPENDIPARLAFYVYFDLRVETGRILWQADT